MIPLDYSTTRNLYDQTIASSVSKGRAILFGAPSHGNVGDQAILLGASEYLREVHDELIVVQEYSPFEVEKSDTVYFLGGGNFGDLYLPVHLDKTQRLRTFKGNKVVFLPQSVYFRKRQNVNETRKAFAAYEGELSFSVRDEESKMLAENLLVIEAKLLPDSSMLLQPKLCEWVADMEGEGALYIRRDDRESKVRFTFDFPTVDIMKGGLPARPELSLKIVMNQIAARRVVVSDRLHGAILATLVGRCGILLPNRYHKNDAFYKTWSWPGLVFASTENQVNNLIKEILPTYTVREYHALKKFLVSLADKYFQFGYEHMPV